MRQELTVRLRRPHPKQAEFVESTAPRKCVRAGRRAGKTTGVATLAVQRFLEGRRVLYATPTQEQVDTFWTECKRALQEPIDAGVLYCNETRHIIELARTKQRIRAKTAWNADTLRGDYADLLILDEYQLMGEDAWSLVGAPMLLDNNGAAVFVYTTKRGKHHSKELFKKATADSSGRWATFVFTSHDNPHLNRDALDDIVQDMTSLAYRMEILAEEIDDDPRALWDRELINQYRVTERPTLSHIVVGVDPPGEEDGAECGIVVAGTAKIDAEYHGYVLDDRSMHGRPGKWGQAVVAAYNVHEADRIIGEVNQGGQMVERVIRTVKGGPSVGFKAVRATRGQGKATRAGPIQAKYERGLIHHVGEFGDLEDQMCNWVPGERKSPDRLDALVWALSELMLGKRGVRLARL